MNPKTLTIKTRACELCDFPLSEFHHFFPKTRWGENTGSKSGIYLCPNHHLMANILQLQIENVCQGRGCMPEELGPEEFIQINPIFDDPFKAKIGDFIMGFDWGRREHLVYIGVYE